MLSKGPRWERKAWAYLLTPGLQWRVGAYLLLVSLIFFCRSDRVGAWERGLPEPVWAPAGERESLRAAGCRQYQGEILAVDLTAGRLRLRTVTGQTFSFSLAPGARLYREGRAVTLAAVAPVPGGEAHEAYLLVKGERVVYLEAFYLLAEMEVEGVEAGLLTGTLLLGTGERIRVDLPLARGVRFHTPGKERQGKDAVAQLQGWVVVTFNLQGEVKGVWQEKLAKKTVRGRNLPGETE